MNILFIYTNINGTHEDCYSFGLASIVSITKKAGHTPAVSVFRSSKDYQPTLDAFDRLKPRIVGFSSVSSQFPIVKELAAGIKKKAPGTIVVCGGVHPTIHPEAILETDSIDAFFLGESDLAFIDFLDKVDRGKSFLDTDNLAYRSDGRCVINNLKPRIKDLDILPYPDKETYPYKDTLRDAGYAPFMFSRGCPFGCSYCSNHAIAQRYGVKSLRPFYRSPESCIREIEETAARFHIERIHIGDDIFGQDRRWLKEFCALYKERIKIRFACLLRANFVDEEVIRLLKDAGCYRISMGVESGNDHVRNVIMKRNMSTEMIERSFRLARKHGIETNAINIIGVPGETEEMLWDTILLNRKIRPTSSAINIFYPYKGTVLGDYCFDNGLVDEKMYSSFSLERRDTVLRFPVKYRKKIIMYARLWEYLVFPFDIVRHLEKILKRTSLWRALRNIKRTTLAG